MVEILKNYTSFICIFNINLLYYRNKNLSTTCRKLTLCIFCDNDIYRIFHFFVKFIKKNVNFVFFFSPVLCCCLFCNLSYLRIIKPGFGHMKGKKKNLHTLLNSFHRNNSSEKIIHTDFHS